MDEEEPSVSTADVSGCLPPPSPLTGCYLLVVIGEPHEQQHKEIILQRLRKGLLSWDSNENHVDLEKELATLTAAAPEGEEARYGERLIQFATENLVTEVLIHPQMNTLMQCMRNLLSSFTRHRHIVHAGYTFAGNASWIMQDGTFSLGDFADAFQENEVQRVIRAYENTITIDIHCSTVAGNWRQLADEPYSQQCRIRVNPTDILQSGSKEIGEFIGYLEQYIVPASLEQLLVPSDVVGNIRFSHPTLYVFPGGQGDAALFGINGFNMLVDGGFSRKACWWDFARHLDRLDAVLFTRINNCSVSGMEAVLKRKATASVYPQIGHFFCNLEGRNGGGSASPDGDKDGDPLLVSLLQQGYDMMDSLRSINLRPQNCYRGDEPVNLYHKVGHGTLDMYVLNPSKDSKYVREFLQKWHNNDKKLFEGGGATPSGQFSFPVPNLVSICALIIWRPANPEDNVTRIMFPGSTPQHKIFEGLEKLKHLEFMRHPVCTGRQIADAAAVTSIPTNIVTSTTTTQHKTSRHNITKTNKDRIINTEKNGEKGDFEINKKDIILKDEIESNKNNELDNKILTELANAKELDRILQDEVISHTSINNINKSANKDGVIIENISDNKYKEFKKEQKSYDKKYKKFTKNEEIKEKDAKSYEKKKSYSETKSKMELTKKTDSNKNQSATRSRVKVTSKSLDKKPDQNKIDERLKRNVQNIRKEDDNKLSSNQKDVTSEKLKAKLKKCSPLSTPLKSAKEASNRKVAESRNKQFSPKRDVVMKQDKKDIVKVKREPISRRPKPISSPVKAMRVTKSPKTIISTDSNTVHKIITRTATFKENNRSYTDYKKPDEENSKSLDDAKQQEIDEREEQEIVREIEAVFNRDSEAEEKHEFVARSDIEQIRGVADDLKLSSTFEEEYEEEYLIIEKEEIDHYSENSIQGSNKDKDDETQKHLRDTEESEKKSKLQVELDKKQISDSEKKLSESSNEQDIMKIMKSSIDKNNVITSQPDEKISTTAESGATTAPTLPEDERMTLDDIKEDHPLEETCIQESTRDYVPPKTLKTAATVPDNQNSKTRPQKISVREIVKTPDEVADLPLHEVVDYRCEDEVLNIKKHDKDDPDNYDVGDVFKRKPDLGFVHEIKVPKDLQLSNKSGERSKKFFETGIEDNVVIKTMQMPSHAELVTVTPGSAPESPGFINVQKDPSTIVMDPIKEGELFENKNEIANYKFSSFTKELRETHITTVDSPVKEEIKIVEELLQLSDKIPSIPEDVEKELEEAFKSDDILDSDIKKQQVAKTPQEIQKIVLDVAEVLKSEKSLEEIISGKTTPVIGELNDKYLDVKEENISETEEVIEIEQIQRFQTSLPASKESPPMTLEELSNETEKKSHVLIETNETEAITISDSKAQSSQKSPEVLQSPLKYTEKKLKDTEDQIDVIISEQDHEEELIKSEEIAQSTPESPRVSRKSSLKPLDKELKVGDYKMYSVNSEIGHTEAHSLTEIEENLGQKLPAVSEKSPLSFSGKELKDKGEKMTPVITNTDHTEAQIVTKTEVQYAQKSPAVLEKSPLKSPRKESKVHDEEISQVISQEDDDTKIHPKEEIQLGQKSSVILVQCQLQSPGNESKDVNDKISLVNSPIISDDSHTNAEIEKDTQEDQNKLPVNFSKKDTDDKISKDVFVKDHKEGNVLTERIEQLPQKSPTDSEKSAFKSDDKESKVIDDKTSTLFSDENHTKHDIEPLSQKSPAGSQKSHLKSPDPETKVKEEIISPVVSDEGHVKEHMREETKPVEKLIVVSEKSTLKFSEAESQFHDDRASPDISDTDYAEVDVLTKKEKALDQESPAVSENYAMNIPDKDCKDEGKISPIISDTQHMELRLEEEESPIEKSPSVLHKSPLKSANEEHKNVSPVIYNTDQTKEDDLTEKEEQMSQKSPLDSEKSSLKTLDIKSQYKDDKILTVISDMDNPEEDILTLTERELVKKISADSEYSTLKSPDKESKCKDDTINADILDTDHMEGDIHSKMEESVQKSSMVSEYPSQKSSDKVLTVNNGNITPVISDKCQTNLEEETKLIEKSPLVSEKSPLKSPDIKPKGRDEEICSVIADTDNTEEKLVLKSPDYAKKYPLKSADKGSEDKDDKISPVISDADITELHLEKKTELVDKSPLILEKYLPKSPEKESKHENEKMIENISQVISDESQKGLHTEEQTNFVVKLASVSENITIKSPETEIKGKDDKICPVISDMDQMERNVLNEKEERIGQKSHAISEKSPLKSPDKESIAQYEKISPVVSDVKRTEADVLTEMELGQKSPDVLEKSRDKGSKDKDDKISPVISAAAENDLTKETELVDVSPSISEKSLTKVSENESKNKDDKVPPVSSDTDHMEGAILDEMIDRLGQKSSAVSEKFPRISLDKDTQDTNKISTNISDEGHTESHMEKKNEFIEKSPSISEKIPSKSPEEESESNDNIISPVIYDTDNSEDNISAEILERLDQKLPAVSEISLSISSDNETRDKGSKIGPVITDLGDIESSLKKEIEHVEKSPSFSEISPPKSPKKESKDKDKTISTVIADMDHVEKAESEEELGHTSPAVTEKSPLKYPDEVSKDKDDKITPVISEVDHTELQLDTETQLVEKSSLVSEKSPPMSPEKESKDKDEKISLVTYDLDHVEENVLAESEEELRHTSPAVTEKSPLKSPDEVSKDKDDTITPVISEVDHTELQLETETQLAEKSSSVSETFPPRPPEKESKDKDEKISPVNSVIDHTEENVLPETEVRLGQKSPAISEQSPLKSPDKGSKDKDDKIFLVASELDHTELCLDTKPQLVDKSSPVSEKSPPTSPEKESKDKEISISTVIADMDKVEEDIIPESEEELGHTSPGITAKSPLKSPDRGLKDKDDKKSPVNSDIDHTEENVLPEIEVGLGQKSPAISEQSPLKSSDKGSKDKDEKITPVISEVDHTELQLETKTKLAEKSSLVSEKFPPMSLEKESKDKDEKLSPVNSEIDHTEENVLPEREVRLGQKSPAISEQSPLKSPDKGSKDKDDKIFLVASELDHTELRLDTKPQLVDKSSPVSEKSPPTSPEKESKDKEISISTVIADMDKVEEDIIPESEEELGHTSPGVTAKSPLKSPDRGSKDKDEKISLLMSDLDHTQEDVLPKIEERLDQISPIISEKSPLKSPDKGSKYNDDKMFPVTSHHTELRLDTERELIEKSSSVSEKSPPISSENESKYKDENIIPVKSDTDHTEENVLREIKEGQESPAIPKKSTLKSPDEGSKDKDDKIVPVTSELDHTELHLDTETKLIEKSPSVSGKSPPMSPEKESKYKDEKIITIKSDTDHTEENVLREIEEGQESPAIPKKSPLKSPDEGSKDKDDKNVPVTSELDHTELHLDTETKLVEKSPTVSEKSPPMSPEKESKYKDEKIIPVKSDTDHTEENVLREIEEGQESPAIPKKSPLKSPDEGSKDKDDKIFPVISELDHTELHLDTDSRLVEKSSSVSEKSAPISPEQESKDKAEKISPVNSDMNVLPEMEERLGQKSPAISEKSPLKSPDEGSKDKDDKIIPVTNELDHTELYLYTETQLVEKSCLVSEKSPPMSPEKESKYKDEKNSLLMSDLDHTQEDILPKIEERLDQTSPAISEKSPLKSPDKGSKDNDDKMLPVTSHHTELRLETETELVEKSSSVSDKFPPMSPEKGSKDKDEKIEKINMENTGVNVLPEIEERLGPKSTAISEKSPLKSSDKIFPIISETDHTELHLETETQVVEKISLVSEISPPRSPEKLSKDQGKTISPVIFDDHTEGDVIPEREEGLGDSSPTIAAKFPLKSSDEGSKDKDDKMFPVISEPFPTEINLETDIQIVENSSLVSQKSPPKSPEKQSKDKGKIISTVISDIHHAGGDVLSETEEGLGDVSTAVATKSPLKSPDKGSRDKDDKISQVCSESVHTEINLEKETKYIEKSPSLSDKSLPMSPTKESQNMDETISTVISDIDHTARDVRHEIEEQLDQRSEKSLLKSSDKGSENKDVKITSELDHTEFNLETEIQLVEKSSSFSEISLPKCPEKESNDKDEKISPVILDMDHVKGDLLPESQNELSHILPAVPAKSPLKSPDRVSKDKDDKIIHVISELDRTELHLETETQLVEKSSLLSEKSPPKSPEKQSKDKDKTISTVISDIDHAGGDVLSKTEEVLGEVSTAGAAKSPLKSPDKVSKDKDDKIIPVTSEVDHTELHLETETQLVEKSSSVSEKSPPMSHEKESKDKDEKISPVNSDMDHTEENVLPEIEERFGQKSPSISEQSILKSPDKGSKDKYDVTSPVISKTDHTQLHLETETVLIKQLPLVLDIPLPKSAEICTKDKDEKMSSVIAAKPPLKSPDKSAHEISPGNSCEKEQMSQVSPVFTKTIKMGALILTEKEAGTSQKSPLASEGSPIKFEMESNEKEHIVSATTIRDQTEKAHIVSEIEGKLSLSSFEKEPQQKKEQISPIISGTDTTISPIVSDSAIQQLYISSALSEKSHIKTPDMKTKEDKQHSLSDLHEYIQTEQHILSDSKVQTDHMQEVIVSNNEAEPSQTSPAVTKKSPLITTEMESTAINKISPKPIEKDHEEVIASHNENEKQISSDISEKDHAEANVLKDDKSTPYEISQTVSEKSPTKNFEVESIKKRELRSSEIPQKGHMETVTLNDSEAKSSQRSPVIEKSSINTLEMESKENRDQITLNISEKDEKESVILCAKEAKSLNKSQLSEEITKQISPNISEKDGTEPASLSAIDGHASQKFQLKSPEKESEENRKPVLPVTSQKVHTEVLIESDIETQSSQKSAEAESQKNTPEIGLKEKQEQIIFAINAKDQTKELIMSDSKAEHSQKSSLKSPEKESQDRKVPIAPLISETYYTDAIIVSNTDTTVIEKSLDSFHKDASKENIEYIKEQTIPVSSEKVQSDALVVTECTDEHSEMLSAVPDISSIKSTSDDFVEILDNNIIKTSNEVKKSESKILSSDLSNCTFNKDIKLTSDFLHKEVNASSYSHSDFKCDDGKFPLNAAKSEDRNEIIQTLTQGLSSEDVSRDYSCDEKYKYESTEKHDKYNLKDNTSSIVENISKMHSNVVSDYSNKTQDEKCITIPISVVIPDVNVISKSDRELETKITSNSQSPHSRTHDVCELPREETVFDTELPVNFIDEIPRNKLVVGIEETFSDYNVQQGIKSESVLSDERKGSSTPPTVPVSPLPKTQNAYPNLDVDASTLKEVTKDSVDDTVTKVVTVGDDVLTQRISTCTEKVSKYDTKSENGESSSELSVIQQSVGKLKTETDTITKVIKEGENVVTQTITTVTTREMISKDDGTPQNIKTTIETTTLSKSSDGSTTTKKDTQTLLSECSSILRSSSSIINDPVIIKNDENYEETKATSIRSSPAKEHSDPIKAQTLNPLDKSIENNLNTITKDGEVVKQNVTTTTTREQIKDNNISRIKEKVETLTENVYPDGKFETQKDVKINYYDDFSENYDDSEDCVEDTTIDTDVSKKVISENNVDVVLTITTVTKKETFRSKDNQKIFKTTKETTKLKERPDGSSLIEKATVVTTEKDCDELMKEIECILYNLTPGEINEEIHCDNFEVVENRVTIKRSVMKTIKYIEYKDNNNISKKQKVQTDTITTDIYPNNLTKVNKEFNIVINDIIDQNSEIPEEIEDLMSFPNLENKIVDTNTDVETITENGTLIKISKITTIIRETLSSLDNKRKKLKTTIEIVTNKEYPSGVIQTNKEIKISLSDIKDSSEEELLDCEMIGDPEQIVDKHSESVFENNIRIERTVTIITTRVTYISKTCSNVKKLKTTVKTITEDKYPDGSIKTKVQESISMSEIDTSLSKVRNSDNIQVDDEIIEESSVDTDTKEEFIDKNGEKIHRNITITTKRDTLANANKNLKKIRTTIETTTVDLYPDGAKETTKDVKITVSESQQTSNTDLEAALKAFTPTGKVKKSTDKKESQKSIGKDEVHEIVTTNITKEEFIHSETAEVAIKTVTDVITNTEYKDGSIETSKSTKTLLTYLPQGTSLDDLSPEELTDLTVKSLVLSDKNCDSKSIPEPQSAPILDKFKSKVKSPVGNISTDTECYTKIVTEGDNEITQTVTVVTTKEIISPEKIKTTVETTTVSKGHDGITKTTKATKTTISEFTEEFEESVDAVQVQSLDDTVSRFTSTMSEMSQVTKCLEDNSGFVYSDDEDGVGSPSSVKSQIPHSPRSNLSFELHSPDQDMYKSFKLDPMSMSMYGSLPDDENSGNRTKIEESSECSSVYERSLDTVTKYSSTADAKFLQEADEHFQKAIEEHTKVLGSDVMSTITSKYELNESNTKTSLFQTGTTTVMVDKGSTDYKKRAEEATTSRETLESLNQENSENTKKTDDKDPIQSWGKPLGLPSPGVPPPPQMDGKSTPKKQLSNTVQMKNKTNQEKNEKSRRSADSPSKKIKVTPIYMDLTYVPHHGNSYYSAVEFFKRVRARYYVFSGTEPSKEIYNALLDAKKTWEDKDLEVTIIPTYDTDVLGYWVTENEEALEKYKIDLSPSASRCTINLQDHETSCAAYRLEF